MIRITIIAFAIFATISFIAMWSIFKAFFNFRPSRKQLREDLEKIKLSLLKAKETLISWNEEELGLLSLKQIKVKTGRAIRMTAAGTFTSIYDEPLIVYGYKKYGSKDKNAILYASTSKDEFVYNIQPDKVEIYHNQQPLGVIHKDGSLKSARNNKTIARYLPAESGLELPVLVHEKPVASVLAHNPQKFNPRAFEIAAPLDQEEEVLFLALGILKLVENNSPVAAKAASSKKK